MKERGKSNLLMVAYHCQGDGGLSADDLIFARWLKNKARDNEMALNVDVVTSSAAAWWLLAIHADRNGDGYGAVLFRERAGIGRGANGEHRGYSGVVKAMRQASIEMPVFLYTSANEVMEQMPRGERDRHRVVFVNEPDCDHLWVQMVPVLMMSSR